MPERGVILRLEDIADAIDAIQAFLAGVTLEDFAADRLRRDAVLQNLQVIGEAARSLPDELKAIRPEIPWVRVIGMRNALAHGYFDVDLEIIWKTITTRLPQLRAAALAMLHSLREDER